MVVGGCGCALSPEGDFSSRLSVLKVVSSTQRERDMRMGGATTMNMGGKEFFHNYSMWLTQEWPGFDYIFLFLRSLHFCSPEIPTSGRWWRHRL